MSHHKHFTEEQLTDRFDFNSKLKMPLFILMAVGLLFILIGLFTATDPGHGDHDEHGATEEHHEHSSTQPAEQKETHAYTVQDGDHHGDEAAHDDEHSGHAHHPVTKYTRTWASFLHSNLFFLSLAMGGLFFVALHRLVNAGWQTAIKRIPEAMFTWLPFALVGFILVAAISSQLYDWQFLDEGQDALIDEKRSFLNTGSWLIRLAVYFGGWFAAAYFIRKYSLEQDRGNAESGLASWGKAMIPSAAFVVFFAFSYTLFSVDWIKSLEPHWFSTIYGIYWFAGTMASTFATMGLLLWFLRKRGYMKYTNDAHMHDIFKYGFGFTIFWGYIFIAQLLLIWYANLPEETGYYVKRIAEGISETPFMMDQAAEYYMGYRILFWTAVVMAFLLPFIGLMMRNAKRKPLFFVPIAIIMLVGHWLDLFQMVMPGAVREHWGIGWSEIGFTLLYAGLFLFVVFSSLAKANLVAKHHPYLEESINHSTGAV